MASISANISQHYQQPLGGLRPKLLKIGSIVLS